MRFMMSLLLILSARAATAQRPVTAAPNVPVDRPTSAQHWTIPRPGGTEAGNVVGAFLETYRPPASC